MCIHVRVQIHIHTCEDPARTRSGSTHVRLNMCAYVHIYCYTHADKHAYAYMHICMHGQVARHVGKAEPFPRQSVVQHAGSRAHNPSVLQHQEEPVQSVSQRPRKLNLIPLASEAPGTVPHVRSKTARSVASRSCTWLCQVVTNTSRCLSQGSRSAEGVYLVLLGVPLKALVQMLAIQTLVVRCTSTPGRLWTAPNSNSPTLFFLF